MSPAPVEPNAGIPGLTPCSSSATSTCATAGRAPEPPRASPAARTSSAARTTSLGSAGPTASARPSTVSCENVCSAEAGRDAVRGPSVRQIGEDHVVRRCHLREGGLFELDRGVLPSDADDVRRRQAGAVETHYL